jgi:hypothetical protein
LFAEETAVDWQNKQNKKEVEEKTKQKTIVHVYRAVVAERTRALIS